MQVGPNSFLTLSEMLQSTQDDSRIIKAIRKNFSADKFDVKIKVKTLQNYELEGEILETARVITISQRPISVLSKLASIFTCCLRYNYSQLISDDDKEVITGYILESRPDKLDENIRKKGIQLVKSILSENQTFHIIFGKSNEAYVKSLRIIESKV
ncbi:MAG: hypothetical protein LVR00_09145 [Rhabdochlamydiaceae bacterium]